MFPLLGLMLLLLLTNLVKTESQVEIMFQNWNDGLVDINWIHPQTSETFPMMQGMQSQENTQFNSFSGHSFEIRQIPDPQTGACKSDGSETCKVAYFTVAEDQSHQTVQILSDVTINVVNGKDQKAVNPNTSDLEFEYDENNDAHNVQMEDCKDKAKQHLSKAKSAASLVQAKQAMEELLRCYLVKSSSTIKSWNDEVKFQSDVRGLLSNQMENYTCDDANLPSSPDLHVYDWVNERDGSSRPVHIKLDRPTSRIHVVRNFASPEECLAMEESAKPKLARATVADGKGGSQLSENRKAMQAGIRPDWNKEEEGDKVAQLSRRVYDYANHVLGLNLTHQGQENLMSIQYFGRGYEDSEPDRYTPHCDGDCTGQQHLYGSRMATMVIYCTIPEKGGHTNFQNSNVHVKPEAGAGVFFSYIDPGTNVTDDHLTQHSGCPMYEGEKKIVTQWIRYGVDASSPWTSFNTLGIKRGEGDD